MKKPRLAKKFLEELARVPIVSVVCEKMNLSRQTIYRWRLEDPEFRDEFERVLSVGRDGITDLAESKLVTEHYRNELNNFIKFQQFLSIKNNVFTKEVNIVNYAKYILLHGSNLDKRELLSCMNSRILLKDKKVTLCDKINP